MTEPEADGPPRYVTADVLAVELGVHLQTVQSYFRSGGLPGRKVGGKWTTTRSAFEAWLTGGPRPATLEGTTSPIDLETK